MSVLRKYFTSLRRFNDYPEGEVRFVYEFTRLPQLRDIFAEFDLADIAGDGDTFSKAQRIMQWVADNTSYDGGSPLGPALPDKIIEFGIREKNPINCANRAILFCDALVSLGIFALPITLQHRPYLPRKKKLDDSCHCHVIAQVWLPEKQCWAAFDPSFNTYFVDRRKNYVSVPQMIRMEHTRKKIISIDNSTDRPTNNGSLCTRIGLLDICIFPGNDFSRRYNFEKQLHLLPESYVKLIEMTDHTDDGWENWRKNMINSRKLKITDLDGAPYIK